jgi:hypothetical protein
LIGKSIGKKTLGKPRHRWEYNIRADLRKQGGKCGLDASGSG